MIRFLKRMLRRALLLVLHGLTDGPFSMRHPAEACRQRGFVALAIRMPGHGTVPAWLTEATWRDWMAATRLAVREARRRIGPRRPLHLVQSDAGYPWRTAPPGLESMRMTGR